MIEMSEKKAIIEAFTDLAPRYEQVVDGELRRFWGWSYNGFIDNLIDMTPLKEDDIILDVATGTAVIPLKLANRGKTRGKIIGLDITLAMLHRAAAKINDSAPAVPIRLTCASAMSMPYRKEHFDVILCGLATHHLDVPVVLAEMYRILKSGGRLTIADVGGSAEWRKPVWNFLIRAATFIYFLPKEGYARARSEAAALDNVYTGKEWHEELTKKGFSNIRINQLPASHYWAPTPLVIRAERP
jgi:ubiquinone/menaquinone biosynthesis C-methylase UbiE